MDANSLDALARALAAPGRRRSLLRLLTGGAVGLATWQLTEPAQRVAAKKCNKIADKQKRRRCRKRAKQRNSCARTCAGCCDTSDGCRAGTTKAVCGTDGARCQQCTGDQVCTNGNCAPPGCGAGGPCLVFLTSTTHDGNLQGTSASGLLGADAICQQRARAAGLSGTYKAWLSDSTGSPDSRFMKSTGPYRRRDGETVADDYTDLTTCDSTAPRDCLANPIIVTETGSTLDDALVWTNTRTSGGLESASQSCNDWSSASADTSTVRGDQARAAPTVTDRRWTEEDDGINGVAPCDRSRHLYCFQQS
jgi:hypothetical protein